MRHNKIFIIVTLWVNRPPETFLLYSRNFMPLYKCLLISSRTSRAQLPPFHQISFELHHMIEIAQCILHVPVLFYLVQCLLGSSELLKNNSLMVFKEQIYTYNSVTLFQSIHTSFITFVVVNSAVESITVYCYRIVDIVEDTKILETISDF